MCPVSRGQEACCVRGAAMSGQALYQTLPGRWPDLLDQPSLKMGQDGTTGGSTRKQSQAKTHKHSRVWDPVPKVVQSHSLPLGVSQVPGAHSPRSRSLPFLWPAAVMQGLTLIPVSTGNGNALKMGWWAGQLTWASKRAAHFRPPEAAVLSQGAPGKEAPAELSLCLCPPSSTHQRGEVPFVTLSFPFLSPETMQLPWPPAFSFET